MNLSFNFRMVINVCEMRECDGHDHVRVASTKVSMVIAFV